LRIIFIFLLKILFVKDFAFFFLLSQKKEEKCSQKEERKTVVDFQRLAENSLKKHERILSTQNTTELLPQHLLNSIAASGAEHVCEAAD
jgi:hypothetical protein